MGYYKHAVAEKSYNKFTDKAQPILEATIELAPHQEYDRAMMYGIKGTGSMFDGKYNFKKVTHVIDSGGYTVTAEAQMFYDSKGNNVIKGYTAAKPKPKPAKAPVKSKGDKTYTVKSGDTLSGIAVRFCKRMIDWQEIETANKKLLVARDKRNTYMRGHWIFPGQKIVIPGRLLK